MRAMKKMAMNTNGLAFALLASLLFAGTSLAANKHCESDKACVAPERCVKVRDGHSCARTCEPKPGSCPEDQRCVKDGSSFVCHPITDGVDL
jgi:hypothetical protein